MENVKKIVESIVTELIDEKQAMKVDEVKTTNTVVLNIKVSKNDLGKIIGKKGRIISSIRTVVGSIYAKNGFKAIIEVTD